MTKADIVTRISCKTGITKQAVIAVVEELMENVRQNVANGESVYLRGFGTFGIKHKADLNFHYAPGKTKLVPAHNEPSFKPCKELKDAVKKTPLA